MKKNLFLITEEEKRRILGLHQSATKRGYLSEQEQTVQYYKDQTGKVIKLVGNYSAPLGSTPATPEEYDAQNKPVEGGGGGQGAKVITNNDKSYDYKEENGKYYYSKKGQNQWVEAKGDINNPKSSLGAIKNLKWDTATPMPSSTNLNPQDKSALTTPGTQPTGASGVAGTSVVQGQPVYYPWVKEGGTAIQNIIDSKKADPNFANWLTELKKLTTEQLEKISQDLMAAFSESATGVKLDSTEAYQPYIVAQQAIKDAIVMAEDLKKATETNGVAGTSGVQGTSGVAGTSAAVMPGKIKSAQQIRQDYRQQKQNERQGARVVRKNKKELEKELKDLQTNYRRLQNKMTPQDKQSYELRIGQIQTDLGNF